MHSEEFVRTILIAALAILGLWHCGPEDEVMFALTGCKSDCTGRQCGDDGCGGSCGSCDASHGCTESGQCACLTPLCNNVCCDSGQVCYQDRCCTRQCSGRQCGDDGCGGFCGSCPTGQECGTDGVCRGGIIVTKYEVSSDTNGDGKVNPGEDVSIRIYLKNTGTSTAQSVRATLSTSSEGVSIEYDYDSSYYHNLNAGDESPGDYPYVFTVSKTTPAGYQIPFSLRIEDAQGNTWDQSFNIPIGK